MNIKSIQQVIFLLLITVPIHVTFDGNLQVYLNRTVHWSSGYHSFPLSFFVIIITLLFNLHKVKIFNLIVLLLSSLIYLIFCTYFIGWQWKLASIILQCVYFFIVYEVIRTIFCKQPNKLISGWFFIALGFLMLYFFDNFGKNFNISIYDYDQYAAPFFSSMVFAFLVKNNIHRLILIPFGVIIYIISTKLFLEADSFYITLSIFIAVLFLFLNFVVKLLNTTFIVRAIIIFWGINITYLTIILLPFTEVFTNNLSILTRGEIFNRIFLGWDFFLGPIFSTSVPWTFSSHSYLFEGFRVFSTGFIFISYFMIKKLINKKNEIGTIISLHSFVVLGLFATPQFHFYTIPLMLIIPNLYWEINNKK